MRIIHITGARPNFPKMAPVERALRERGHSQYIIHTGQHFDPKLSQVFFEQLNIPEPDINLGVRSASHAKQTAAIMSAIEQILKEAAPDAVVVYGDVNSTLAATIVAAKLQLPVVHVEAGLRSNDRSMPEEINRIVVDALSDQMFTTAEEASYNLIREGAEPGRVHFVGNPMIDTLLQHRERVNDYDPAGDVGIEGDYALVTLHRPANVDHDVDAEALSSMLAEVCTQIPVLFPIHPRAASRLNLANLKNVHVVDPLSYFEFLSAMARARLAITDSGGVQEETTVLGIPCLTVRPNTERPVTITHGTNRLVTRAEVPGRVAEILRGSSDTASTPPLWDGAAGQRIARLIESRYGRE